MLVRAPSFMSQGSSEDQKGLTVRHFHSPARLKPISTFVGVEPSDFTGNQLPSIEERDTLCTRHNLYLEQHYSPSLVKKQKLKRNQLYTGQHLVSCLNLELAPEQ